MFTGLIETLGKVRAVRAGPKGSVLTIRVPKAWKVPEGDSVAVNGVCLSARKVERGEIHFECIPETLRRTTLGNLKPRDTVNLERPLTLQALLGGHFVQGHVDGVGIIKSIKEEGKSKLVRIGSLGRLSRFFVEKGSVAVDGVSLTIVKTFRDGFSVGLIPLTLEATTLGRKRVGQRVNIEVDMIVKTVARLLGLTIHSLT